MNEPDCQECGACCANGRDDRPFYLTGLSGADLERLTTNQRSQFVERGNLLGMQCKGRTICKALDGEIGIGVRCLIYENRPDTCILFGKGSPPCLLARASCDIEPVWPTST